MNNQDLFTTILFTIGGVGTILWWTFRRHIKRVDRLEELLLKALIELQGIRTELAVRLGIKDKNG